ncbi:MAG: DUF805 domain-containing protein [Muribaculaceae bacterium]|nr:DUF805 domain-containing protein [Muribaculaceae bacterium]
MNWYVEVLKNYVNFSGRARRSEYWYFALFNAIISIVLTLVGNMIDPSVGKGLSYLYALAVFLPGLGVAIRRMHDIGKSGWYLLLSLIPIVGCIILIIWFCKDSQPGENNWGANPKGM